ncbi:hypothetical protein PAXRUDRAFT_144374, partial [Paxillus rubicundulus Ve08.2h10]
ASLRECCWILEIQILKLTTEHDCINTLFQQLRSTLGSQTLNSTNNPHTDPLLLTTSSEPRPTHLSHPKVQFWSHADYKAWKESPEYHASVRGTMPYLEDEDGQPISASELAEIRKTLRTGWHELVDRRLAPQSWGQLSASGCKIFHSLVESTHPIFKLGESGWKLNKLVTNDYASWKRTHIDDDGNPKLKGASSEEGEKFGQEDKAESADTKKRKFESKGKGKAADKRRKGECF